MVSWIDRELKRRTKQAILHPHVLIGSGGTFTCVAEIILLSKGQGGMPLRGYEVTRAEVSHLVDRLRKMSPKARRNVPGLSVDRADIIVAGVTIIDRLMNHFGVNRVQIHDRGVRDGLLLTMLDQTLGRASENPHDQETAIERFAVNCGVDMEHGRHVARLAGQILSQLVGRHGLTAEDRPLLEAAARLQDVGYLINYDQHHKHSYHLILNSRLAGFKPAELEIIANVARYHRGSEPKKKHENFARLAKADRDRVKKLAGILRIAGGLDRSNSRQVQAVQVLDRGGRMAFSVLANDNPDVDLWAAENRAELFESALDCTTSFEWHDPRGKNGETEPPAAAAEPKAASPRKTKKRPPKKSK
jgi:exopolyphosphatase/guanosine-5'-triphosphate,3'-diphosphate pyrophosphatase